ncbi:MAG: hypothetical protein WDW36_003993 [Sanguina aurantia]
MALPARPYDSLYDATYSVSGARDHHRQQTVSGGFMLQKTADFPNMFSQLQHYPATTYKFKNTDKVATFVERAFHPAVTDQADLQARSASTQVSGPSRPKFFRRPLLAMADSGGPIVRAAPPDKLRPLTPPIPESRTRTYGTQSDYREGETQTTPWSPDYVVPEIPSARQAGLSGKHHCEGPEVLQLRDLKFGDGLPPGLQEVRRVEKMREKRAFEATLPPINDTALLPLRQRMIEEWEAREWSEREAEIVGVQMERLELLEQAMMVREEEFASEAAERVTARKAYMLHASASKFAGIQSSRIKTMRQLIEARKYVEKPRSLQKPSIVERYVSYSSDVYAPMQREGRFPETKPQGKEIETEGYVPSTLAGVADLEAFLPARLLEPRITRVQAPQHPAKLTYKQREDKGVQEDLCAISQMLDSAKASWGRGIGECWPAPLTAKSSSLLVGKPQAGTRLGSSQGQRQGSSGMVEEANKGGSHSLTTTTTTTTTVRKSMMRAAERPPTPELPPPPSSAAPSHSAVVLVQALLRGRAAQSAMYEGRVRRQELIMELRHAEQEALLRPEERPEPVSAFNTTLGSTLSALMAALAEPDPVLRSAILDSLSTKESREAAALHAEAVRQRSALAAELRATLVAANTRAQAESAAQHASDAANALATIAAAAAIREANLAIGAPSVIITAATPSPPLPDTTAPPADGEESPSTDWGPAAGPDGPGGGGRDTLLPVTFELMGFPREGAPVAGVGAHLLGREEHASVSHHPHPHQAASHGSTPRTSASDTEDTRPFGSTSPRRAPGESSEAKKGKTHELQNAASTKDPVLDEARQGSDRKSRAAAAGDSAAAAAPGSANASREHRWRSPENRRLHEKVVASAGEAATAFATAAAAAAARVDAAADAAASAAEVIAAADREAAALNESLSNEIRMDAAVEAITSSLAHLANHPDTDSLDFHLVRPSTISHASAPTPVPPVSDSPSVEEDGGDASAAAAAAEAASGEGAGIESLPSEAETLGVDPSFAAAAGGLGLGEEELGIDPSFADAAADGVAGQAGGEGGGAGGEMESEAQEIDFDAVAPAEDEEGRS